MQEGGWLGWAGLAGWLSVCLDVACPEEAGAASNLKEDGEVKSQRQNGTVGSAAIVGALVPCELASH